MQRNLINSNSRNFWKCWNGCFKKSNGAQNLNVNGLCDDSAIANYLAEEFKRTCTPHDIRKHEEFKFKYISKKAEKTDLSEHLQISVQNVNEAVNKIESNKAPGFDQVTIEHIINAHPSVTIILTRLFNIMLHTGLIPDDFGVGVTTPIPKFKGTKKNVTSDDYRGITICPVISKIFEHCIASNFDHIKTSKRQFGFKKNVGCSNSIHTVRKAVKFFNSRNTTVNIGSIDLSKAFDKTNIFGILCLLQEKNVNIGIINILENWFKKKSTAIKWHNVRSRDVPLMSGVKQGGILSPLLFSLYVDVILQKLEKSGIGCFIGRRCCNSYMYADDLILLSITVTDLQRLLDMCNFLFSNLDLPINISKCHCVRIGPRYNLECKNLTINGKDINWVDEIRFLGVTISKDKVFKCTWEDAKKNSIVTLMSF